MRALLFAAALTLAVASTSHATVFMTQQQALDSVFPKGTSVERQTFFLTPQQLAAAKKESGANDVTALVVRYVGRRNGAITGYAYFDAHRVRTLPESILLFVTPQGTLDHIDILSFNEPGDYLPKRRWLDQFHAKPLNDDLSLNRAIHPISGATLSGRAILVSSRRTLAIHQLLGSAPNR